MPNHIRTPEFWDLIEAREEAGQDRLRSAVEWGVFQRLPHRGQGTLLNLKSCLEDGYFARDGKVPPVMRLADGADPEAFLKGLPTSSLDEIFGLDFFQLHPDLEQGLAGLSRTLRTGGLLLLNFFSRDHFDLADSLPGPEGSTGLRGIAATPGKAYSPEQVAVASGRHGLETREIIPYSSCYGNSLWIDLMKNRYRWEWFLDLLSTDRTLFQLALFLEERIIARLATVVAPRFLMVLEKTDRPSGNRPCLDREESLRKALTSGMGASVLADAIGMSIAEVREALDSRSGELRNLAFFQQLWSLLPAGNHETEGQGWSVFLPDRVRNVFLKWQAQERMDSRCLEVVRGWPAIMSVSRKLRHRGVPLGPGLLYEQVHALLRSEFGCFRKGKSA